MCTSVSVVQCTMEMKELLTTGVLELNDSLNHPLQVELLQSTTGCQQT